VKKLLLVIFLLLSLCRISSAQLKDPDKTEAGKNFWHGLTGRDSLSISRVTAASFIFPSYSQIYNRDYWKIPVVWGGIGGLIGAGIYNNNKFHDTGDSKYKTQRNWCYVGAALVYWGSLLDGVVSYNTGKDVVPARATLYSALLPGLGQIYNGESWKLPIIYGGLAFTTYLIDLSNTQYQRYRKAYNILTDGDPLTVDEFNGGYTADNLKHFRDQSRRNRDYAVVFTVLIYALNVIDANVFATLSDFDISDNLSLQVKPAMLNFDNYASSNGLGNMAVGMQMRLTF